MRKVLLGIIAVLLVCAALFGVYFDSVGSKAPTPVYSESGNFDKWRPVAILGDTQATTWAEKQILRREDNSNEQKLLFEFLKKESPSLLVFLGDLEEMQSSKDSDHYCPHAANGEKCEHGKDDKKQKDQKTAKKT